MNRIIGTVSIIAYSIFTGIITYQYVPPFYEWVMPQLANTGPLGILVIGGIAWLLWALTLPISHISKITRWEEKHLTGYDDRLKIICVIASGAPLTIAMFIKWWGGLGGSWAGLGMVIFSGPIFGYFVYYSISDGMRIRANRLFNQKNKNLQVTKEQEQKNKDFQTAKEQRERENKEFNIKIMNENDARELVKITENPEELKLIIKSREYKTHTTEWANEDAQKKLRRVLGYSSEDYYCPKCNEIVTVVSKRKYIGASSAGNTHFWLNCPHCSSTLGDKFINENW